MGDPRSSRQWQKLRARILARDAWTCRIRGDGCTVTATTVDHIVAVADGGPMWDPSNLRAACVHCNCGRPQRNRGANLTRLRYRTTIAPTHTRM